MLEVSKRQVDRYEYVVYQDESNGVSTDFYIKSVLIAKCKCCRKVSTRDLLYWIVCRDPIGYPPDHPKAGKQLVHNTLMHGPLSKVEAQEFMDKRIQRVDGLKRAGD